MRIDLEHQDLDTATLLERAREGLKGVCAKFGVHLLVLFGSHARGDSHRASDIDLAVLFGREISPRQELEFLGAVTQACGTDRVDLVNARNATPLLLKEIASSAVPLYESSPGKLDYFRMVAFARFFDTEPFRKALSEHLASRPRP